MSLILSRAISRNGHKPSNLRILRTGFRHNHDIGMKLWYTSLASALVGSSAWTLPLPVGNCVRPLQVRPLSLVSRSISDFSLKATVVPEELSTLALTPQGNPIAEGHVVSLFHGGLVAVRVDDDIITSIPEKAPSNDGTTQSMQTSKSSSLGGDLIGRQVVFANGEVGVVVTHRPPIVFVYTDMKEVDDMEGTVKVLDSLALVDVQIDSKVVDCFGRVRDQSPSNVQSEDLRRPIFAPIPKVADISLINSPLVTGVTMFDALAPIGKGQNMLMIGHDIQNMRQYVCDMLSIQKSETKCIYASTGDHDEVEKMLKEGGLSDDVMLVRSGRTDKADNVSAAAESTLTAATACAIAESLATKKGMDTFVVVDTIDQHKNLWDATTRVLVDVFGIDAVVKSDRDGGASSEMRGFFSSLVQRSAQYKQKRGGGSVTLLLLSTIPKMTNANEDIEFSPDDFANSPDKVKERIDLLVKRGLPLTAATLRKIQIPIPSDAEGKRRLALQHVDDLISMSDGQIWLDEELEQAGRRPAMDFHRSVTRIGIGADTASRADAAAMRRVVEGLRLDLSQSDDMDGADVKTNASITQKRNALTWMLAMHQPSSSGARKLSESCTALLAASKGYLGESIDGGVRAGSSEGTELMMNLLTHVNSNAPTAVETIDSTQDLNDETREAIIEAIESYFS